MKQMNIEPIQSIIFDERFIQIKENHQNQNLELDVITKIRNFQKTQEQLKNAIINVDVIMQSPNMKYRQFLLSNAIQNQQKKFNEFSQCYKQLGYTYSHSYHKMYLKFKDKLDQHKQEARLELSQQIKSVQFHKQIDFQETQYQDEWKHILRGVFGIFGAFTLHLIIGAINRWPIINPYLSSYYKITSSPQLQTRVTGIGSPIVWISIGITMKWGFAKCQQYGEIKIMLLASFLAALTILGSAFMPNFYFFLICHNCLFGLFAGFLFLCPMKQCHNYYPNYKLTVNSIILVGTGLGAFLFGLQNTQCMNPHHQKPPSHGYYSGRIDYIARNWPYCLFSMSYIVLGLGIVGCIMIYPMIKYNHNQGDILSQKDVKKTFQNSCHTDEQAIKSGVFWNLAILIILSSTGNFYVTMNYENLVKAQTDPHLKNSNHLLFVFLSGAFFNGFTRIIWGDIFKRIGFKFTFLLATSLNIIVYTIILLTDITYFLYIVLFAIIGSTLGGLLVMFPNSCLLIFGEIIGQSIYGYYWAFFGISNFVQYLMGSHIDQICECVSKMNLNWVPYNKFKIVFVPFILFAVIGMIICIFTKFQGRWQNDLKLLRLKIS